jgi:hypothetical protein
MGRAPKCPGIGTKQVDTTVDMSIMGVDTAGDCEWTWNSHEDDAKVVAKLQTMMSPSRQD